jgi:hypothetical protein
MNVCSPLEGSLTKTTLLYRWDSRSNEPALVLDWGDRRNVLATTMRKRRSLWLPLCVSLSISVSTNLVQCGDCEYH